MNPSLRIDGPDASVRHARWIVPAIGLLTVVSMLPGWATLAQYWLDVVDYNYGVLIAIVAAVWLWYARSAVVAAGISPNLWFLPALAIVLFAWYSLWQGHSEMGAQLLMPVVTWLSLTVVVGLRGAIPLLMPIGYLYFAVPIWDELLPLLQQLTILGSSSLMRILGVPVTVTGTHLIIAEGTFNVLYECSGLRYVTIALALAYLTGALEQMKPVRLALFLSTTALLAVLANWIRVCIVMYAGHITGMSHYFVSDDHKGLGNVVFGVLLVLIYLISRRMRGPAKPAAGLVTEVTLGASRQQLLVAALLVAALLATFAAMSARAAYSEEASSLSPRLRSAPMAAGEWQGPLPSAARWMPIYESAADSQRLSYQRAPTTDAAITGGRRVEIYLNVYGRQQQGAELIYFRNTLQAPGTWRISQSTDLLNVFRSTLGREPNMTEHVSSEGERWLFGRMYVVGGVKTASALAAQVLYGKSTMIHAVPAGLIALAVPCKQNCAEARETMQSFWKDMGATVVSTVPTNMDSLEATAVLTK